MPWHAQSTFTAAPCRPLTRDERRIWLARVELHRRAGALTALHALVAAALLKRLGADGRLDPAEATIAADAGCCPRTVSTTKRRLRWLGMLDWTRRIARRGSQVRQVSCAYLLSLTGSIARRASETKRQPREVKPPRSVAQQMAALAEWAACSATCQTPKAL